MFELSHFFHPSRSLHSFIDLTLFRSFRRRYMQMHIHSPNEHAHTHVYISARIHDAYRLVRLIRLILVSSRLASPPLTEPTPTFLARVWYGMIWYGMECSLLFSADFEFRLHVRLPRVVVAMTVFKLSSFELRASSKSFVGLQLTAFVLSFCWLHLWLWTKHFEGLLRVDFLYSCKFLYCSTHA